MEKNDYPKEAAIYKLTCRDTGKIYIGKTINANRRFREYKRISNNKRGRCFFENVVAKYGWESFDVEILESFGISDKIEDNKYLLEKEASYIESFKSTDKEVGYNICERSTDRTGTKASKETLEKMRVARLGKKHSEETKEKCRLLSLGRIFSEETKQKIGEKHRGKIVSEETKEKMRNNNLGKTHSEETKEKMREVRLGKKLPEEHSINISKGKRGKPSKLKGTVFSDERKEKCRQVWIERRLKKL